MIDAEATVIEIVERYADIPDGGIKLESVLDDDCDLDEIDRIEITMDIEENLDIEIDDVDKDKWKTVGDIVKCVQEIAQHAKSE